MRRCKTCGKQLHPGRTTRALYCGPQCRALYHKGHRPPELEDVDELDDDEPEAELLTLEGVARELARQLRSRTTPPTAKAGLAREYRATLAEIEKTKPRAKDAFDEIGERRERRNSA